MPIVLVHGVNNPKSPGYRAGVELTGRFLKQCFEGAAINGKSFGQVGEPEFPYWGDLATKFAWNMASLPKGSTQSLGAKEPEFRAFLATVKDALPAKAFGGEPLLALAKQDFGQAVELIASLAIEQASEEREAEVAEFAAATQAYAEDNAAPPWLQNLTTDDQLLGNLSLAVTRESVVQAQGLDDVINAVKTAATKLRGAATDLIGEAVDHAGDFASTKLVGWTRAPLNENLGRFFGDVFIYLDTRGNREAPGAIPNAVLAGYDKANTLAGEPFVVIGHSLGGVISFDLLSHYRPDLEVDLFVSVGSQVAHFEEMKLYHTSDESIGAPAKASTPANIKHWINLYDEVDIFSYSCAEIFDRVDVDEHYDTKTYVVKAHSEYFKQARFYKRLREYVDQLG